jgi:hypothetical protein
MIDVAILINQDEHKKRWYQTERNTADLIQRVVSSRHVAGLSGEQLWHLLRLTWITKSSQHWKRLKVPALANLFGESEPECGDMRQAISSMQHIPEPVSEAAIKRTGFVNFYAARRNSTKDWCSKNVVALRQIVLDAQDLGPNIDARFDLAATVAKLSPVPLPSGKRPQSAASLVTPLLACLDSFGYFPAINGASGIEELLDSMGISDVGVEGQIRAVINLVGTWGISDARMIDVCAGDIADAIRNDQIILRQRMAITRSDGRTALKYYDDEERIATQSSGTEIHRQRHNKMTNAIVTLFAPLKPEQRNDLNCRYDVLLRNYDSGGRDLLIEVQPDPDKGSLRIAIGQLFDYRRFLPRRFAADLAVLTITPPCSSYLELLSELQITRLWFHDERCSTLSGDGKAWQSLKGILSGQGIAGAL